jgi:hypothetical protein
MSYWKHDPGPCPVCEAPHTTCTAPDASQTSGRTVTPPAPPRGGARQPQRAQTHGEATPSPTAFTTATYSRKRNARTVNARGRS